ncbi:hypothetical protein EU527_16180 [Candidatus Thorarchaeota archaeon]|nr:MAG: hypothetical protein EU527_16180 [Candidatus Thorarchaeota archaeon]
MPSLGVHHSGVQVCTINNERLTSGIESDVIISSSLVSTSLDYESMTINSNVDGEITLRVQSDGYCDINVCFNYLSCLKKESQDIPIIKKVLILPDEKQIVALDISDYFQGTFLSIRFLINKSLSLYVATEYEDIQYSAHVLIDNESVNSMEMKSLVDSYVQSKSYIISNRTIAECFENENAPSTVPQIQGIPEPVSDLSGSFAPAGPPPREPRIYFLNHYMSNFTSSWILDIGQVLIDYSWITHEITRRDPSISQVKSDLMFYSRKYYYKPDWYSRTLGAYMVNAHGTYDSQTQETLWFFADGFLDSSDIRSCWISTEDWYCRPDSCIITSLTCYGLFYTTMGDAFVDYNARAYVGSNQTLPANMNLFIEDFWGDNLAIGNTDIDYALANSFAGSKLDCYYSWYGDRTLPD